MGELKEVVFRAGSVGEIAQEHEQRIDAQLRDIYTDLVDEVGRSASLIRQIADSLVEEQILDAHDIERLVQCLTFCRSMNWMNRSLLIYKLCRMP